MSDDSNKNVCDYAHIILDNIMEGVFTIDQNRRITSYNRAAEKITGIKGGEAIGQYCYNVFRANICESKCALYKTMKTGRPVISKTIYIINSAGDQIPISISTAMLRDEKGKLIGAVEILRDISAVNKLRKEIEGKYTFSDIISKNSEMQRIFNILPQVAESGSMVLIEGESGTGKELFARVIHDLSKRKKKKLIAVNCGALPDTLLESELFGYKAGAFTDAKKDKKGRFAQADQGTIFLDEIGDISPAFQVRLLRFLQDKIYEPLGATEPEKADVRVIAASNKNLMELVKQNIFRQDLFYRINIIKLTIPPLRERLEDIPLLTRHFIAKYNRIMDKNIESATSEVLEILMRYSFPGNVRELENIIERAMVLCRYKQIQPQCLPPEFINYKSKPTLYANVKTTIKDSEKRIIIEALERNNWNRLAASAD
ncbi:sigma 54-interacting transcriptional regulator, partial [bacterium]|nr:sigma 54-interacting transcriptional regulator [bacterium]